MLVVGGGPGGYTAAQTGHQPQALSGMGLPDDRMFRVSHDSGRSLSTGILSTLIDK